MRGGSATSLARRTLDAYSRSLGFLDDREVVAGIRPVWLPGHTPGHSGFRIDAAGKAC
jgi:glyoxylase-like metal-dependent hydrolase (beta-lactamase superfamily II)